MISHLFNKAVEWKWILARPAKINRLAEENVRITYLTQEQSARLLEAAREHSTPQLYLFTLIALETSMRKNEILEIQLQNIDLARMLIYVPRAKRGPREQPITRHLAECLRPHVELAEPDQKWLLPSKRSECGHVTYIERAFREAVLRAGLDPREVCRHTLRHTAVTHLIQAGVDLPTVQRISGHKTLQMVVRYAHQNGEHIQAAMDKLERRFHGSVTGEGATEQASGMGTSSTLNAASDKLASPEDAKTTPPPVELKRDSKGRLLMKGKAEKQEQKPSTRRPSTAQNGSAQVPKIVVKKRQGTKGRSAELPSPQKKSQEAKRK